MSRLVRRVFSFAAAVSAVLFVAVCAAWIWSYKWSDRPHASWGGYTFHCDRGRFWVYIPLSVKLLGVPPERCGWNVLGLGYDRWVSTPGPRDPMDDEICPLDGEYYAATARWPLAITAALPACRAWARWRSAARRRRSILCGLCPDCGYDLHATPDRCPECGVVSDRKAAI